MNKLIHHCHTRLHLGFSAKLRIWQVPTCKMEPRSGNISCNNHPPTRQVSFEIPGSHLLQIRKSLYLRGKLKGLSQTRYSCQSDICPCNICPGDNFSSPIFLDKIFLATKILLDLKIFYDQTFFSQPKSFLWTKNCLGPNFFFRLILLWTQIFFGPRNFSGPKSFLDPTFLFTLNLFWTQNISGVIFFGNKLFLDTRLFMANKFLRLKIFWTRNAIWTQIF